MSQTQAAARQIAGITIGQPIAGGANNRLLYQSDGKLSQSANLVFDGTALNLSGSAVISGAAAQPLVVNTAAQYGGVRVNNTNTSGQTNVYFARAGVDKWQFGANLGIGADDFYIYQTTVDAVRFYISSAGNVLVNSVTDNTIGKLQVNGKITATTMLLGAGVPLARSGENYNFQLAHTGGAAGVVIGTDDGNVAFLNLKTGNRFWHWSGRGNLDNDKLEWYYFDGTNYGSPLFSFTKTGDFFVNQGSLYIRNGAAVKQVKVATDGKLYVDI